MSRKESRESGSMEVMPRRGRAMREMPLMSFQDLERWFEDQMGLGFGRGWGGWPRRFLEMAEPGGPFEGRWPKVDLVEREEEMVVRAELPGVRKEDLDLSLTDHTVTIKALSHSEHKEEQEHFYRHERRCGEFMRTLELPEDVDADKAKASLRDGMLELILPKMHKRPRKRIEVS